MSHPFKQHRETKKSYERVSKILEEQPAGASKHATGSAYSRSSSKSDAVAHGGKYARGGRLPTAGAESGVGRLQKAGK
ncbi:MAG TPA: hypothetical protein VNM37_22305 [Candidatus Dormibacteraeota bacterium]|jgi:hypothetical protein|nr:hypothetical protein [Candidatus Dormibacteraeota bacterium]